MQSSFDPPGTFRASVGWRRSTLEMTTGCAVSPRFPCPEDLRGSLGKATGNVESKSHAVHLSKDNKSNRQSNVLHTFCCQNVEMLLSPVGLSMQRMAIDIPHLSSVRYVTKSKQECCLSLWVAHEHD